MKIIESPREGIQGLDYIIPFKQKLDYIQSLLSVGFHTVEVGSFVSPKLIPQMADSAKILERLDYSSTNSGIMVLVVNNKGTDQALAYPQITHLSFPFSFSQVFLKHNLNVSQETCLSTLDYLLNACAKTGKTPVIYCSMAFGNPYGEPWNIDLLLSWIEKLKSFGIQHIPLSNVSIEIDASLISSVYHEVYKEFPEIETGLHLHTSGFQWKEKVEAAWQAGCRRFDTVIHGFGGCPMAGGPLLGNLDTANLISFLEEKQIPSPLDTQLLTESTRIASGIFYQEK
ncbi:MAG: hypothetical protein AB9842_03800 [Bacteroidales bacterium]